MGPRSGHTLKVRNALELIGLEDDAHAVVAALGARNLVIVERKSLIDPAWLRDRLELLEAADRIRPYEPS